MDSPTPAPKPTPKPAAKPTLAELHKSALHFLLSHVARHGDAHAAPAAQRHLDAITALDPPEEVEPPIDTLEVQLMKEQEAEAKAKAAGTAHAHPFGSPVEHPGPSGSSVPPLSQVDFPGDGRPVLPPVSKPTVIPEPFRVKEPVVVPPAPGPSPAK